MTIYIDRFSFEYFRAILQYNVWVIKVKIKNKSYFTIFFQVLPNGDSVVLNWQEKIILFKKIEDLIYFISNNNISNIKNSTFYGKVDLIDYQKVSNSDKKKPLVISEYDFYSFKILKNKKWSKLTLKQLETVLNDLNLMTDFYFSLGKKEPQELADFLDAITFILDSERKNLDSFDKKSILQKIDEMIKEVVKNIQVLTRV